MSRWKLWRAVVATATTAVASSGLLLAVAAAQPVQERVGGLSKFPIDRADPVSSIPDLAELRKNPLEYGYYLQDLSVLADKAYESGQLAAAARFFEAIGKAVPEQATGPARQCKALDELGEKAAARDACREALGRKGVTVADYQRYARLVLAQAGDLSTDEIDDVDAIVGHLRSTGGEAAEAAAKDVECALALRVESRADQRSDVCEGLVAAKVSDGDANVAKGARGASVVLSGRSWLPWLAAGLLALVASIVAVRRRSA